jgi:superoxide dismutase
VISGQIMELHHAKHHATYVTNLNKALEQYAEAEAKQDLQKMISLQGAINFNGGGAQVNRATACDCADALMCSYCTNAM